METIVKGTLYNWVQEQLSRQAPNHRFGANSSSDKASKKNGNLNLTTTEDAELVINEGLGGSKPEVIFVPKGSLLTIFRDPRRRQFPADTVAAVFTEHYQATLKGSHRTSVRKYQRYSRT